MLQVLEVVLGDFVEVMLGEDEDGEDHCGVMEVVELFEDDQAWQHNSKQTAIPCMLCKNTSLFCRVDKDVV